MLLNRTNNVSFGFGFGGSGVLTVGLSGVSRAGKNIGGPFWTFGGMLLVLIGVRAMFDNCGNQNYSEIGILS